MATKWWIDLIIWLGALVLAVWAHNDSKNDECLGGLAFVIYLLFGLCIGLLATVIILLIH